MNQKKKNRVVYVSIFACLIALTVAGASYAAVPVVSPDEGTVGTVFTITGTAFGAKTGKVYIGSQSCKVLKWNDSTIECKIKRVLPTGEYDLLIRPKGGENVVILPNAFDIRGPKLDPPTARPHFVSPGNVVTVTGAFFGEGIGDRKIQIRDHEGDIKNCRILDLDDE
ncbi:MAG: IPT/TIG domain-containing protein [Desulfosalsimonadaceae bacterium]